MDLENQTSTVPPKITFFDGRLNATAIVETVIPTLLARGEKIIKVWAANCETGEDAYSLAALFDHHLPTDVALRILATESVDGALATADNGVYPRSRYEEILAEYRDAFVLGTGEVEAWFRPKRKLRDAIVFRKHDLSSSIFPGDKIFNLVVCGTRDAELRRKFELATADNGFLIMGSELIRLQSSELSGHA